MNIFIDDDRFLPSDFDKCFRKPEQFIEWINNNKNLPINILSLDFYFINSNFNGTQLIQQLNENLIIKTIRVHSNNQIGYKEMMKELIKKREKLIFYIDKTNDKFNTDLILDKEVLEKIDNLNNI